MRAHEFITEASYPGNIGAMEVMKAFQVATPDQKKEILDLINRKEYKTAWKIIQVLTGVKLQGAEFQENKLDKPTPTIDELVKKHNVSKDELLSQLKIGIKVELEHTSNEKVAREIALDHLSEKPDYYEKLKQVEENFADGKNPGRKGLSRRVGIPKKATLSQLEKIAKSSTGERRRMAQWQLNMRRGKKK